MKLVHVVGARPNFMKLAPLYREIKESPIEQKIVHTGQHYDAFMSDIFFEQLQIDKPHYHLGVGSGTHTEQTARTMLALEPVFLQEKPDWVVVYGDVNSTVAAALVCAKNYIKICHVEAGLRSFDRTMPEEINRILTDQLSDLLLTPSPDGNENLLKEGISNNVHLVGNIMIDSLVWSLNLLNLNPNLAQNALIVTQQYHLKPKNYLLVTLHRPSNVDDPHKLQNILTSFSQISEKIPILFPIHPRTKKMLSQLSFNPHPNLIFEQPLGYLDFLYLQQNATAIVTDSGGIQEETTYLQIPCLTLRPNTERPITITEGTNMLIGDDLNLLQLELQKILEGKPKKGKIPHFWDGNTAQRIKQIFLNMQ